MLFMTGAANAQVSTYTFSQPTTAGYSAITGGPVAKATGVTGATSLDDVSYPVTLPFTFNFGNMAFTTVNVSTNGSLSFGTNASIATSAIIDNTPGGGVVAAFNADLRGIFSTTATTTLANDTLTGVAGIGNLAVGQTISGTGIPSGTTITAIGATIIKMSANATATSTGTVTVNVQSGHIDTVTLGTAPNRTFIIQWTGFQLKGAANTSADFQIQLSEGGGLADAQTVGISYGNFFDLGTYDSAQVGLRGNISNTDFNNRAGTTSWTSTTAGASNAASVTFYDTNLPVSGLLFLYTPPPACSGTPNAGNVMAGANPVCAGTSTTLTLTGATTGTGIGLQWMSSPDNIIFTAIAGATSDTYTATLGNVVMYYNVVVTCNGVNPATSNTVNININNLPTVKLGNDTTLCPGATITLDAGNPGSSYLFSNAATTQTTSITTAGTYRVAVTDALGCIGRDTIVITAATNPVVNLGNDTVICPAATIIFNAGNAGSTFLYSTGATTQTTNVMAAGTYSVRVTNADKCIGRDTIVIIQGVNPVVSLGNDTTICSGDFLLLDAGNPGSTYLYSNLAITRTTEIRTPALVTVKVTNANKCVGYDTIQVNTVLGPVVTLGNDTTICPGATITLNAGHPGSTYLFSNAATTQTTNITTAGTYNVRVTSIFGCIGRDTIVIAQGVDPVVKLGNDTTICPGVPLTLDAGNVGSTYLFSNAATTQTVNVAAAGTYSVRVTNTTKCIGRDTIVVSMGVTPVVNLGNDTVICPGATITLNAANPGSTYLYSNAATTQTTNVTAAGTFSVAVTNATKCIGRDTIVIAQGVTPLVNLGNDTVLCPAATITLNAANTGSTYLYSTGATTRTLAVTSSGTYSVRVTDANKCIGRDTIVITAGVNPIVNLGNDTLVCPGDTVRLNAANTGSTYLYSNGATTQIAPVTTGGTYSVRVTNVNNCIGRDTIVIATGVNPIPRLGNDTVLCPAANITLNGGNFGSGFAYLYSNSVTTQTTNITSAGTYTLRVTNTTTGCRGRDTIVIAAGVNPIVNLGNDTVVCPDMTITLDAGNPGSTYLYNTGATTRTLGATLAGTYSVRVTNVNKCVGRDTIVIFQGSTPIVSLGRDTSVCAGLALTLDAGNPGSTYLYNTGANTRTLSVLPAGTYWVAVTNAQKCVGHDTIDISIIPTATVNFVTQSKVGTTVTFGSDAMSSAGYAWSFGDGATDNVPAPAHNYTTNGVYTVRLIVSNQCGSDTATTTVTISGLGTGNISLSNDELGLYPNPATTSITLNNKSALKMQSVTVLNSLGSVVMLKDGIAPKQETLDLGALPAGTYMVRIQTDGGIFLRRLQLVK